MQLVDGIVRPLWRGCRIVSLVHSVGLGVAFTGMVLSSVSARSGDGDPHGDVTIFSMMGAVVLFLPLLIVLLATRLVWRGRDQGLLIMGA